MLYLPVLCDFFFTFQFECLLLEEDYAKFNYNNHTTKTVTVTLSQRLILQQETT